MAQNINDMEMDFDSTVKRKKRQRIRNTAIAVVIALVLVVIGLYFCSEKLFFVKKIDIVEQKSEFVGKFPYTEEQMLEGLGIQKGIGLYDFDANKAQKDAKYNLSYIKQIKISRRWPSTVVAKTTLEAPYYYVSVGDDLYIVSDELKVLEKTESSEKIELYSLIYLDCEIHSCIVGESLGVSEDIAEIIYELDEKMSENGVKNEVSSINASDKFDISITYGTKYVVKLGDSKSLGTKLEFMKRIIEDREGDIVGGTIDVSDEKNREAVYKKFS